MDKIHDNEYILKHSGDQGRYSHLFFKMVFKDEKENHCLLNNLEEYGEVVRCSGPRNLEGLFIGTHKSIGILDSNSWDYKCELVNGELNVDRIPVDLDCTTVLIYNFDDDPCNGFDFIIVKNYKEERSITIITIVTDKNPNYMSFLDTCRLELANILKISFIARIDQDCVCSKESSDKTHLRIKKENKSDVFVINQNYELSYKDDDCWVLERSDGLNLYSPTKILQEVVSIKDVAVQSLITVFMFDIELYDQLIQNKDFINYVYSIFSPYSYRAGDFDKLSERISKCFENRHELNPDVMYYILHEDLEDNEISELYKIPKDVDFHIRAHDHTGLRKIQKYCAERLSSDREKEDETFKLSDIDKIPQSILKTENADLIKDALRNLK